MPIDPALIDLLKFLFAGGIGGIVVAVSQALKLRSDTRREDRKQSVDAAKTISDSAATIADAAGDMVKLKDSEAEDLKKQIAALRKQSDEDRTAFAARLTDAESRLARSERRAADSDERAERFRKDVVKLGERLTRERKDHQGKINKLVIIIEKLFEQVKAATGSDPDVDLDALKQMVIIEKSEG